MTPEVSLMLWLYLTPLPLVLLSFAVTRRRRSLLRHGFPAGFSLSGRPRRRLPLRAARLWRVPILCAAAYAGGWALVGALISAGVVHERIIGLVLLFFAGLVGFLLWVQVGVLEVALQTRKSIRGIILAGLAAIIVGGGVGVRALSMPYSRLTPEHVSVSASGLEVQLKALGARPGDELLHRFIGPDGGIGIATATLPASTDPRRHDLVVALPAELLVGHGGGTWVYELVCNERLVLRRRFRLRF